MERKRSEAPKADVSEPASMEESNPLSQLSEEEQMRALMGFGGFDSTKGKPVDDNARGAAVGGVRHEQKRDYRQYMNRRGGFNRPLDKK
jgi:U4/U6.U5 tri-snRNP-associated protein 3